MIYEVKGLNLKKYRGLKSSILLNKTYFIDNEEDSFIFNREGFYFITNPEVVVVNLEEKFFAEEWDFITVLLYNIFTGGLKNLNSKLSFPKDYRFSYYKHILGSLPELHRDKLRLLLEV